MKKYNPLILNLVTDEPSFENPICKWWLCEVSKSEKYCLFLTVSNVTNDMNYVVLDNENHEIVYHSKNLEQALMHLTMCEKSEELNK